MGLILNSSVIIHADRKKQTPEIRQRQRNFIDELKRHVPVHAVTDATGELMGKVSGEQAAKGIRLPFDDLAIGASALEQGYGVATLKRAPLRNDSRSDHEALLNNDLAGHQPADLIVCLPGRRLRARRCDAGRAPAGA